MATAVELGHRPVLFVGDAEIRPSTCEILGPGGRQTIEPKVMQVLVALVEARGETVTRDDLAQLCWDGRIVGDDAINRVILKIRRLSDGVAAQSFVLKTIHKIGYRLCEVEREPDKTPDTVAVPSQSSSKRYLRLNRRAIGPLFAGAIALAALTAGGIAWRTQQETTVAAAPASIAVLPFRNLSSGNPYFAEGVAEELMGQLAREPAFRVAGRTSSGMFKDAADVREVGRKLDVAYVLDGSVRTQGDRVRVQAALVNAGNGMQVWSQSYDGTLDDVFAMQQAIGGSIASALKRKLVRLPPRPGPLVTSGDVYSLYLTARGLIRTRDDPKVGAAAEILRRALTLDPNYAPAWSSLASATGMAAPIGNADVAGNQKVAVSYARRALRLAPNLAEAHGTLGMLLGFESPEAMAHIRRAAQLDPRNAEIQFWLGMVESESGNFEKALVAWHRASEIDPYWFIPGRSAVKLAVQMGDDREAQGYVARMDDIHAKLMYRARTDIEHGDLSQAAALVSGPIVSPEPRAASTRRWLRSDILLLLGLRGPELEAFASEGVLLRTRPAAVPSIAEWRQRNSSWLVSRNNNVYNALASKRLIDARRGRDILPNYDGEIGLLGLGTRQQYSPARLIRMSPLAAMILRQGGRNAEADRLLAHADVAVSRAFRQGRVPFELIASAAEIWALQGRRDRALAALERATDRGWLHLDDADLADLADEPALRSLRGQPRFERVRDRINARLAKERREVGPTPA